MLWRVARRRNQSGGFDERDLREIQSAVNGFMRLDRRLQMLVVAVLLIGGAIAAVVYYRSQHARQTVTTTAPVSAPPSASAMGPNLLLGNPSGATTDPANR